MDRSETPEIKIFYCYANADQDYRKKLETHITGLKLRYRLTTWFDRKILPGDHWEKGIEDNLNSADLIFLLVSPDFMESDYCKNTEMARAIARHEQREAI